MVRLNTQLYDAQGTVIDDLLVYRLPKTPTPRRERGDNRQRLGMD